ncbi:hypothetical protein PT974_01472 [Cladobotryum mycophilum]|uniref:GFO/IDH/MocA-like oxidoreductase domain-containing protein n=1 Tax=Cladobotryum mycophilum TaxID=491253 RepID=A0ABR0T427_9HYPO
MSYVDQPNIARVHTRTIIPAVMFKDDDIRFKYELSGGAAMDLGTYNVAALRNTFGTEPEACESCEMVKMPAPYDQCDASYKATFRFPGGAVGELEGTHRSSLKELSSPTVTVTHRPVVVEGEGAAEGEETTRTRKVHFANFMLSAFYHRIDIEDEFVVTNKETNQVVKTFVKKETKKAYTYQEMGVDQPSEIYWQTYRHMLEQFVNRVRGREGTGAFVSNEDSLAQMKALDMMYEKSGLGLRPTSNFSPESL